MGAGFSRNWGGWLASELNGDLLGRVSDIDLRRRLQNTHAFETVLAQTEAERTQSSLHEARYQQLKAAVIDSFHSMNLSFADSDFQFNRCPDMAMDISRFLARFDAIFTLNQDLLLELHYRPPSDLSFPNAYYPGLHVHTAPTALPVEVDRRQRLTQYSEPLPEAQFVLSPGQPIFKLHGSVDWRQSGKDVLILGDKKPDAIQGVPLLRWYYVQFREMLNAGNTRLMVIGYSFHDPHIDDLIRTAGENCDLSMFLVDPAGIEIFKPHINPVGVTNRWTLQDVPLIGVSQRPLSSTFSDDKLEHGKLMRFFS